MATTNKNFKVKNGLDVNGPIGVGTNVAYGDSGQVLTSQGTGSAPIWAAAPEGPPGENGADAIWNFTGAYGGGVAYAVGDIATYEGQTWYRVNSNGGNVGDTPVEGTFWTLLAAEGADGAPGAAGDPGISALSWSYLIDLAGTADRDPGNDTIGFVTLPMTSSTQILVDDNPSGINTTLHDLFLSIQNGYLTLTSQAEPGTYATYSITSCVAGTATNETSPGSYVIFNVTLVSSYGTFSNNSTVNLSISLRGPAGAGGNSFETISANGTSVVADSSTDTLTITPGDGISITGNATSDTITFTPNVAGAAANGIVTTGTQTFAGAKTFSNTITASANIVANTGFVSADTFRLDTTYTGGSAVVGEFSWDPDFETARLLLDGATLQIGQEHLIRVKNASGSVAIPDRTLVMFAGATGDTVTVSPANSSNIATNPSDRIVGVTTEEISADDFGFVTQFGFVNGVNTAAWTVGTLLYSDPATPGGFVTSRPAAPSWSMPIAAVTRQHANTGRIFVRALPGQELEEIDNVQITSVADNELLAYNSNTATWINQTAEEAGVANLSGATFTGNVAGTNISLSGDANVTGTVYANVINANTLYGNIAIGNVTGLGTNVSTFLTTPNSLNFLNTITDETGTGNVVFSTSPVLTTPNIGAAIGTSLNVTANVNASTLRLTSTTDVTNVSTTHAFQIGADSGNNIRIDDNEISRYNNGVVAQLTLNLDGGDVAVGASTSTVIIAGSTQLGLEETQKVVDAGSFYTFANNTYVLDTALGNYFKNITTQRVYNSSTGWVIVGNNTSTALTGTSLTHTLVSSGTAAQGDVAIVVATIDSATNATPTTSSSGWTTNAAAATTYGSAVFYKTMGASPDTTIVVNYGATDIVAVASTVIRSSNILPVYVSAVATPTRANAISGVPTPAATTTTIANTLVVVAGSLRNDVVSGAQSLGPSGYSNYILANVGSVAGTAAASMLATKFVATIGTETPTAFSPRFANGVAVSDYSSAWTFQVAAYADPTITLTNSSFSATYPASTYVLHINNPSAAAAATITWTDATYSYSWQGGTAPTLSSIQPNNIVILETIDGTYLKGALLDSYA